MITRKDEEYKIIKELPEDKITTSFVGSGNNLSYLYKCHILIDQIAAYESGARLAKIVIVRTLPEGNYTPLSTIDRPTDSKSVNNLLLSTAERRRDSLANRDEDLKKKILFTDQIDIFSKTAKYSLNTLKKTNFINIEKDVTEYRQVTDVMEKVAFDQIQTQNLVNSNLGSQRAYSTLLLSGKDPAKQIVTRSTINDAVLARKGLGEVVTYKKDNLINEFIALQDASQGQELSNQKESQIAIIKTKTNDVLLPVSFTVPYAELISLNTFILIAEMRDRDGNLIQKKEFLINHGDQVNKLSIPKKLPAISIQKSSLNSINVNVFNKDDVVSSVNFYARYNKNFGSINSQQQFAQIGSLDVGSGQEFYRSKLKLRSLNINQVIVRALPTLSSGIVLGNFDSKLIKNNFKTTQGVIYAYFDQDRSVINVNNAPAAYDYVQVVRRSITKREKTFSTISPILKINNGGIQFFDTSVKPEHIYEYSAVILGRYGDEKRIAQSTIVRTSNYTAGTKLNATVLSQAIEETNVKTKFNIELILTKDTDTTLLLQNLKNIGIDNYYETEITKLSADLKNIVKAYARRINTTTGVVTDLGVIDAGEFEDTAPLGEVYIFEGLVRSQADLLEEIGSNFTSAKILDPKDGSARGEISSQVLTSTTSINKKNYTQKFFSKKSLLKGTISSGVTRDYSADDSGFLAGRLGVASSVDTGSQSSNITISNTNLITADRKRRLLSFDVEVGSDQLIDFFIIACKRGDNKSIIGVCHHNSENLKQYFVDLETDLLSGVMSYSITPVLYDGTPQREYTTQDFEVS